MMRILVSVMALLVSTGPALATDPLSRQDREALVGHLEKSRAALLAEVEGLSQAQLTYQPAADKWAILDCIEHLARTEALIRTRVEALLRSEPGSMKSEVSDQKVLSFTTDRSQSFNAPDPVRPTREWATSEQPLKELLERREAALKFARTTQLDLRAHVGPNPALGNMDAYQWILFMSGHMLRHTDQIREIKKAPKFPE